MILSRLIRAAAISLVASAGSVHAADIAPDARQYFAAPPAAPAPATALVAADAPNTGEIAYGRASAPVVVVEYASVTCPHCAAFFADAWPKIKEKYVDAGLVRWVFRDLSSSDPLSVAETMLLHCTGTSKQKAALEGLFREQKALLEASNPLDAIQAFYADYGLDAAAIKSCFADQKLYDDLAADRGHALRAFGIEATPTFFIGDDRIKGTRPFADFDAKLDALVKRGGK